MSDAQQFVSLDDVQKLVDEQLAKVRADHDAALAAQKAESDARVDSLQAALEASQRANQVQSAVPEHGGGPGLEIADTWSQYEQEQARAEAEAAGRRAA